MSKQSIFCLAASPYHADRIVAAMRTAEFAPGNISLLFSTVDPDPATAVLVAGHTSSPPDPTTTDVGTGALGWIAGIGPVDIPTTERPFLAGGPIVSALNEATPGDAAGPIVGALLRLGLPGSETLIYDREIRAGHVLIAVQSSDPVEMTTAQELFTREGAGRLCTFGKNRGP